MKGKWLLRRSWLILNTVRFESDVLSAIILIALLVAAVSANIHGNGRPGCQTQEELTVRDWRNLWDPTRFWRCETINVPAVVVRCEDVAGVSHLWSEAVRACVHESQWVWTPNSLPPSLA